MKANESALSWHAMQQLLISLKAVCEDYDVEAIRALLLNEHIAFTPSDGNCDLVSQTLVPENLSSKIKRVI